MAARPGEDSVATLFGDIHYFYGPPTDDPPHHRFDRGSYVYLFEDANQGRARIEIANQPGTDRQDAFDGYLDKTRLRYSYKHTCLVTLTVGDVEGHEEWHLPTYDPHNQNKYHYKLHSLDIYFWTQPDALQFVNGIRRVLPASQCEILDEPAPPPPRLPDDVSSVVQKLEKAAISDSQAQQAQLGGGVGRVGSGAGHNGYAPPPLSAVSAGADSASSPAAPSQTYAPIAYNPAAPPAPEQVRPREKTPPLDDGGMNPLHQTLAHDAATPFSPGLVPSGLGPLSPGIVPPPQFQPPPGAPTFPAPPQHSLTSPGMPPQGFGTLGAGSFPPQHPGLARAATMPAANMLGGTPLGSPGPASPGFGGVPSAYPGSPGFAPPPQHTPTPPGVATSVPPPPPPGGFSQYSYAASNSANSVAGTQSPGVPGGVGAVGMDYSIHQQVYRPTETETAKYRPKQEVRGKFEENAGRLERGVTGMLKKFEKKFG
ncbi:hypothetical protein VTK73DRAFT_6537 [Phialemonium thermophilum]|uniref:RNA recognition motif-containing protein n=1 Tax=Phialemonium thermophilum TaxID=223376 RepID=A0ABR3XWN6_9PEZI